MEQHLHKPRVLSPLRSFCVRNEVDLVPLVCEDAQLGGQPLFAFNEKICTFFLHTSRGQASPCQ